MVQQAVKIDKEYNRGFRHGRLNVYNPGIMLFGKGRKSYIKGYKQGMLMEKRKLKIRYM